MQSNQRTARIAGVLYLVVVLAGIFSLGYVPSQLHVTGDAAATVDNIAARESLFRLGILAGMICYVAFLVLPLVLYKLLSPYGKVPAVLMVVFAVASVPISLMAVASKLDILSLLGDADYLQVFTQEQLQAQVMLSLEAYRNGLRVAEIFWGLWLLPFGYLVYRSGILPKVLGILLILGCVGYLVEIIGRLLFTGYADTTLARFAGIPASVGEIGICLWLLVLGAREHPRAG
jgi:hypothetical protein